MLLRAKKIVDNKLGDPLVELSGSTLNIYLTLLYSNRPLTIREIQRIIGFKSPNSVRHHLEKLVSMGYVKRENLGYIAVKPAHSLLNALVSIGRIVLPRRFFMWLSILLISTFYLIVNGVTPLSLITITTINAITTYDLLDTYRMLKPLLKLKYHRRE